MSGRTTQHNVIVQHNADGSKTVHLGVPLTSSAKGSTPIGQSCSRDSQCMSGRSGKGACGRPGAQSWSGLECCASGETDLFAFLDYCTEMPKGTLCYSDAMCASGFCYGNKYGLGVGTCQDQGTITNDFPCSKDENCRSGYCKYTAGFGWGFCEDRH